VKLNRSRFSTQAWAPEQKSNRQPDTVEGREEHLIGYSVTSSDVGVDRSRRVAMSSVILDLNRQCGVNGRRHRLIARAIMRRRQF
jgi:hypothetical protein